MNPVTGDGAVKILKMIREELKKIICNVSSKCGPNTKRAGVTVVGVFSRQAKQHISDKCLSWLNASAIILSERCVHVN